MRDPVGQVRAIYDKLDLGDFDRIQNSLQAYLHDQQDYQPNQHETLDENIRAEIRRRWRGYAEKYGYAEDPAGVQ